ncbi:MAG: glycosyltransferase family 2 protein [Archaeoglobus sp.]|nr:glycosyltransferase family 2 protein [Archaeoglobus sp.]
MKVSVVIVSYNHKKYLKACLESVLKEKPYEIILVDNGSDGTAEFVRDNYPYVKVIKPGKNLGYAGGNNLGVKHARGDYIVILNPDTIVEKGWLKELLKPLKNGKKVITTPKILIYDGSAINTCGNINHFTGLTFTRGLGERPSRYYKPEYMSGFSGCCFAMKKKDFLELGGFDDSFFTYNEDSDLSWRASLNGFKIVFIPTSIVKHDYELKVYPEKIYYLEKNRYLILKKYLSRRDFLILFPSFLLAEILTFGYAIKSGWKYVFYKLKAIKDCLFCQMEGFEGDKRLLFNSLSTTIPVDQLTFNRFEKLFKVFANKVFELNYRVAR